MVKILYICFLPKKSFSVVFAFEEEVKHKNNNNSTKHNEKDFDLDNELTEWEKHTLKILVTFFPTRQNNAREAGVEITFFLLTRKLVF